MSRSAGTAENYAYAISTTNVYVATSATPASVYTDEGALLRDIVLDAPNATDGSPVIAVRYVRRAATKTTVCRPVTGEYAMPNEITERIAQRLRSELEKLDALSGEDIDAVIAAFTVFESSSPHTGHVQYRLVHVRPEIERRSDIESAISRAIHAAGYYIAGEE